MNAAWSERDPNGQGDNREKLHKSTVEILFEWVNKHPTHLGPGRNSQMLQRVRVIEACSIISGTRGKSGLSWVSPF